MPLPRPAYISGRFYHFYNRGCSRISIFREPDNYLFVIRKMKAYSVTLRLQVIAYCLMPNHYHFLIRQDGDFPAGMLPQRVYNSYSKAYNKRYDRSGTLFEDNYHVKAIVKSSHLLHLCRYIHGNPVKDGMVSDPADWPYSNYPEWVGLRQGTLYDPAFVREHFSTPGDYRVFLLEDLLGRKLPEDVRRYMQELEDV